MISPCLIMLDGERPDWPFLPVAVPCGSARTIQVAGKAARPGVAVTGIRIRVTNTDGVALVKDCVYTGGVWSATFPASHFANYGTVKNGVAIFVVGKDENGDDQLWMQRVGDLRVFQVSASETPGGTVETPKDVYHKSAIVDGVQHYKREVLTYSERQHAWGAEYVGDYVFIGGDFVPFGG